MVPLSARAGHETLAPTTAIRAMRPARNRWESRMAEFSRKPSREVRIDRLKSFMQMQKATIRM
jgi:hypothetical protein